MTLLVGCAQKTNKQAPERAVSDSTISNDTTLDSASTSPDLSSDKSSSVPDTKDGGKTENLPSFSLATSEYPSWSTFIVAGKAGAINPDKGGEYGPLEKKWQVDIVLEIKDYDPCITLYGGSTVDAVCITNIDALKPSMTRPSTVIMPTSTSVGGDKVIAVGIESPEDLKNTKTYGLGKSVSQYVFYRGLEKLGLNPKDYQYESLDPGAAATALQTGSNEVKAICVWNPFALETLRNKQDSRVIFDSSKIPEEVIDSVVIGDDILKKDGGDRFACCICDAYYSVCKMLDDPKTSEKALAALGENFCHLSVPDMKKCTEDTSFYRTPEAGIKLFSDQKFQTATMPIVIRTAEAIGMLDPGEQPKIGFNDSKSQLNFTTEYMLRVESGK